MSQFLLSKNKGAEKYSNSEGYRSEQAKTKVFYLDRCRLSFSWFEKNNFNPVYEDQHNTFFCNGILYFEGQRVDKNWRKVASLWGTSDSSSIKKLNGFGNLLVYSSKEEVVHIVTSRMGFLPVYFGKSIKDNRTAVGTHPDEIADLVGENRLDKLSIAEFISTSCIAAPHTYYENIKQLEPASVYKYDGNKLTHIKTYWKPNLNHDDFADSDESAKLIADYIKESVNKRISNNNDKGLLLLSGGLDSRAVLFAPENPSKMLEAVTFYNEFNTELELASQLAQEAGVQHHHLQRAYDYYGNLAVDAIKLTGGMWNLGCLHTSGFNRELSELNQGVLLSGMYFDTFFKGFAFDKKDHHNKWTGQMYKGYPDQDIYWDTKGTIDLASRWKEAINKRRVKYFGYESIPKNELTPQIMNKIKYSRIGNMARIRSGGMDMALYKSQYYDMIISDNNFSNIFGFLNPYDEIKPGFKRKVVENVVGDKVKIADSNVLNSHFVLNNYYLTAAESIIKKRLKKIIPEKKKQNIGIGASWIDWDVYRENSEVIRQLWQECKEDDLVEEVMTEIMNENPFLSSPDSPRSYFDFFNLITVGLWLKHGYKRS